MRNEENTPEACRTKKIGDQKKEVELPEAERCRWLPIESPFRHAKLPSVMSGTDWRRVERDQNASSTSDP